MIADNNNNKQPTSLSSNEITRVSKMLGVEPNGNGRRGEATAVEAAASTEPQTSSGQQLVTLAKENSQTNDHTQPSRSEFANKSLWPLRSTAGIVDSVMAKQADVMHPKGIFCRQVLVCCG